MVKIYQVKRIMSSIFGLLTFLVTALPSLAVSIEFVTVGNPNNAPDTTGYGSVSYSYKISKHEITVSQYNEFVNSISSPYMVTYLSWEGNYPVAGISWFNAARFCNWLHGGDTETGAYNLNGATSGVFQKNPDALYWIPSEDEWYKAAYYDPLKDGIGGYWKYPNRGDSISSDDANINYSAAWNTGFGVENRANVGSYTPSYYGTFDQGGNVWEWAAPNKIRGGSYNTAVLLNLDKASWDEWAPETALSDFGFRIATIPEPSALSLLAVGLGVVLRRRRRTV